MYMRALQIPFEKTALDFICIFASESTQALESESFKFSYHGVSRNIFQVT